MKTNTAKVLTLDEINRTLEKLGSEKRFKGRIDLARKFLLKLQKHTRPERKSLKEKITYDFKPSKYDGQTVYVSRGACTVLGVDVARKQWSLKHTASGRAISAPEHAVRFKPVDDRYRDHYVKDTKTKTASGSPSIHCGDAISDALLGLTYLELSVVVKDNDLKERAKKWEAANPGMYRMHLGNVLRARLKRGEAVRVGGKDIK